MDKPINHRLVEERLHAARENTIAYLRDTLESIGKSGKNAFLISHALPTESFRLPCKMLYTLVTSMSKSSAMFLGLTFRLAISAFKLGYTSSPPYAFAQLNLSYLYNMLNWANCQYVFSKNLLNLKNFY
jgi:hypothetical protein